jgi:drug/metabolite transporter (DMT)-like permease
MGSDQTSAQSGHAHGRNGLGESSVLLGIAFMLVGIFMFVSNDVLGKWLVATYGVGQILFVRSAAALAMLVPMMHRQGWAEILHPPNLRLQVLRVALGTAEVACFYLCVSYLPLADVVTIYLSGPIWVAALSGPLLGERVDWRQWIAILVGFCGVVIAMRPSADTIAWPSLIALVGSLMFALLLIVTRRLRGTSDAVLITWQTVGALLFGLVLAPFGWATPSWRDLGLLALLGVVSALAYLCVNRSLKLAPAAVVVPYQYTQIAWAVLLGWLVFGDIPATAVFIGSAVIVAAGLYIFLSEQRAARRRG